LEDVYIYFIQEAELMLGAIEIEAGTSRISVSRPSTFAGQEKMETKRKKKENRRKDAK
jgi:hypothetical protein